jgi:hypothetical protein
MTLCVDQDVFRLQVPICDSLSLMEIFKNERNLGCIEARCGLVESTSSAQIAKYFAARAVVKLTRLDLITVKMFTYHHVQRVEILETSNHVRYEWMAGNLCKHISFIDNVFDLSKSNDWLQLASAHLLVHYEPSTLRSTFSANTC